MSMRVSRASCAHNAPGRTGVHTGKQNDAEKFETILGGLSNDPLIIVHVVYTHCTHHAHNVTHRVHAMCSLSSSCDTHLNFAIHVVYTQWSSQASIGHAVYTSRKALTDCEFYCLRRRKTGLHQVGTQLSIFLLCR